MADAYTQYRQSVAGTSAANNVMSRKEFEAANAPKTPSPTPSAPTYSSRPSMGGTQGGLAAAQNKVSSPAIAPISTGSGSSAPKQLVASMSSPAVSTPALTPINTESSIGTQPVKKLQTFSTPAQMATKLKGYTAPKTKVKSAAYGPVKKDDESLFNMAPGAIGGAAGLGAVGAAAAAAGNYVGNKIVHGVQSLVPPPGVGLYDWARGDTTPKIHEKGTGLYDWVRSLGGSDAPVPTPIGPEENRGYYPQQNPQAYPQPAAPASSPTPTKAAPAKAAAKTAPQPLVPANWGIQGQLNDFAAQNPTMSADQIVNTIKNQVGYKPTDDAVYNAFYSYYTPRSTPNPQASPGGTPQERFDATFGNGSFQQAKDVQAKVSSGTPLTREEAVLLTRMQGLTGGDQNKAIAELMKGGTPKGTTATAEGTNPVDDLLKKFKDKNEVDTGYFDPLAQYVNDASKEQLDALDTYKTDQQKAIEDAATAREAELASREAEAADRRRSQTALAGLEENAALMELDRGRRSASNNLRSELAAMGAYGTTGSGELDLSMLSQHYDGKVADVRSENNKKLQELELSYSQIRDAIASDRSKSAQEKANQISDLNGRALSIWQNIQSQKNSQILALAQQAKQFAVDDFNREYGTKMAAIQAAVNQGATITDDQYKSMGVSPEVAKIYSNIAASVAKDKNTKNALEAFNNRITGINLSILPDFSVDGKRINQLAGVLGVDEKALLEQANAAARALKVDYEKKLAAARAKIGSGGVGVTAPQVFQDENGNSYYSYITKAGQSVVVPIDVPANSTKVAGFDPIASILKGGGKGGSNNITPYPNSGFNGASVDYPTE